ncbi:MAG: glycerate kinase, partial [Frankiales bacterium]|nr:glycerate kinase [Frankiales bacterium]
MGRTVTSTVTSYRPGKMRVMRVVVAPDSFGGTLSAVDAAAAIADGWRSHAPGDEIRTVPMSDGGPGFVDVLHSGTGGRLVDTCVAGPLRGSVGARFLVTNDRVYVEAADACGLHLVDPSPVTVRSGHTTGLGELLREASVADRDLVVGIGGTATNDGGAGLVRA